MGVNRRNVLIGLGAVATGGGAAFGSGAFTSVTADRSMSVSAVGDSSALITLDISGDLAGSNGDTIEFSLGNDVNLDAVTRFDGVFTITNNGNNSVSLSLEDGSSNNLIGSSSSTDMYFENGSTSLNASGGSTTFDVVFDTTGITTAGNENFPSTISVVATDNS